MENLTFDRLLILLLFILLPLFNWLLGQIRKQRSTRPLRREAPPPTPAPIAATERAPPMTVRARREQAAPGPPPAPVRRSRAAHVRDLLRHRQSVQRGIVVMTVLGPCRALEPPE